jgi:hypothetical protein
MAEIVPKLLYIGNLQMGNAYTAPSASGSYAIVKSINVCNTGTANETFTANLVLPGNTNGVQNKILADVVLSGSNTFSYETSIVVPAGSSIYLSQPTNNLTFTISGVEYNVV